VLCEKAFTTNAAQAKILVELAKKKNLFLMEAVWTRYFPLVKEVRAMVQEGKIGEVKRVFADLGFWNDVEKEFGTESRVVKLDLAGGALLDRKEPLVPFRPH
jgi:predicted dehydrogenase